MSPVSTTGLARVAVSLRPEDLIAAWRPDAGCLVLTLGEPLRLQQRVVARVTVVGLGVAATVTGRVVSSSRHGDLHRVEIAPDELARLADPGLKQAVVAAVRAAGYADVDVDPRGYRRGSLNAGIGALAAQPASG